MENTKVIITCALTGILTDPQKHSVPVTAKEMGNAALEAYNAGASIVHCHFRDPKSPKFPTWDPEIVSEICEEIRSKVPKVILNMSTGVVGSDISGPCACLRRVHPEMAALNAGSLNYLRVKENGEWAWPPFVFDNPVEKIQGFLDVMSQTQTLPEFECFDFGMVRSVGLFAKNGMITPPFHLSLVMGVQSGMSAQPELLPFLIKEMPEKTHWQVIAIGQKNIWPLLIESVRLGGHARTGLEDTFYLPSGEKTDSNGKLVEALTALVRSTDREIATPEETKKML
ncbi:MAG: 3-keto-5-aminohexanoate cleavage protein [Gammaproteobacteria bacterium]|nr:3-keto-5-aminohexanoate cleavage protein [Gammaproteobacteria bacterium]